MSAPTHEIDLPTQADTQLARESLQRLTSLMDAGGSDLKVHLKAEERPDEEIALPAPAVRLVKEILTEMARGRAVTLLPIGAELTTQQAADLLLVSRPYLIGLLEAGKIPFRTVGQHRRVRLEDLLSYKRQDDEARRRIADELTAEAQEMGLGY